MGPTVRAWLGLLLSSCWLAACPPPRLEQRPERTPESAARLLEQARHSRRGLTSLRARAVVVIRRGGKRLKLRAVVAVARPARLRLETESVLGQSLSIMVCDGREFTLWDMEHGRLLRGRASEANLARVLPVPLDGAGLAAAFLGEVPLIAYARESLRWDEREGAWLVELENGRQRQQIWFHPRWLVPRRIRLHAGGKLRWQLESGLRAPAAALPATVERLVFSAPVESLRVEVRLRSLEGNVSLPDELFTLQVPEDVAVEWLDEAEAAGTAAPRRQERQQPGPGDEP